MNVANPSGGGAGSAWRCISIGCRPCRLVWNLLHNRVRYIERGAQRDPEAEKKCATALARALRQLGVNANLRPAPANTAQQPVVKFENAEKTVPRGLKPMSISSHFRHGEKTLPIPFRIRAAISDAPEASQHRYCGRGETHSHNIPRSSGSRYQHPDPYFCPAVALFFNTRTTGK